MIVAVEPVLLISICVVVGVATSLITSISYLIVSKVVFAIVMLFP